MARKKKTVFFKVNICQCSHGEDLHQKGGTRACQISGCRGCMGYKFHHSVTRQKEVFG